LLFVATFLVLTIKWFLRDRTAVGTRGSLMISLPQTDFNNLENQLKGFLTSRLKNLKLESMSVVDTRVNLQYQYKQEPTLDWTAFANELNRETAPANVEIFVG
jgi:spore coat polysaccharide biosynthesis predicted glycosyltransferase SpsG